jgi:hypothetical protein
MFSLNNTASMLPTSLMPLSRLLPAQLSRTFLLRSRASTEKAPHIVIAESNRIVLFAALVIARFVLARLSSRPDRCYQRGGRGALCDIACLNHAALSFTGFAPFRICPAPRAAVQAMPVIARGVCSARTGSVLTGRGCLRTAVLDVRTARKTGPFDIVPARQ